MRWQQSPIREPNVCSDHTLYRAIITQHNELIQSHPSIHRSIDRVQNKSASSGARAGGQMCGAIIHGAKNSTKAGLSPPTSSSKLEGSNTNTSEPPPANATATMQLNNRMT